MTTLVHDLQQANGRGSILLRAAEAGERHLARSDYFGHPTDRTLFPVDLYESDTGFTLVASLPGIRMDDVRITVEGDQVTVVAHQAAAQVGEHGCCLREERYKGPLARTIALPALVRSDAVRITSACGVLTLHLAKAAARP